MSLSNNKGILIYGFSEDEKAKVDEILSKQKLSKCRVIESNMAKTPLKSIIEGLKFEVWDGELPSEKVVLFNNLNDRELENVIKGVREAFGSAPIFAVITEQSIKWTFEKLIFHLVKEREWFKNYKG